MSDSLRPHESQPARPPCPSPSPGVHSDSYPSSQWCHPAISSSVAPFSSCPQSLPASESFRMSQLFAPSQASAIREWWTPRCSSWFYKRQRNQKSNCQHLLDHWKSKRVQKNIYFCFIDYPKAFDSVNHNKLWKNLKKMGIPDTWPASWEISMQVKKKQNWIWNNSLVPNQERSMSRLYIVTVLI